MPLLIVLIDLRISNWIHYTSIWYKLTCLVIKVIVNYKCHWFKNIWVWKRISLVGKVYLKCIVILEGSLLDWSNLRKQSDIAGELLFYIFYISFIELNRRCTNVLYLCSMDTFTILFTKFVSWTISTRSLHVYYYQSNSRSTRSSEFCIVLIDFYLELHCIAVNGSIILTKVNRITLCTTYNFENTVQYGINYRTSKWQTTIRPETVILG